MKAKWISVLLLVLLFQINGYSEEQAAEEPVWQREFSLGYTKSSGNTEASQLSATLSADRKIEHVNEINLKADLFYSSSNGQMDAQRWQGMGRYAFSFGETKKWYNFYKFEADHDKFANVDYRLIPAAGVGYWLYDLPEMKVMAELAIGFEHTDYSDRSKESNEAILIPRAFFEKTFFEDTKFSQDLSLYPALDDFSDYRLHSETALTTALNEKLSLRLSLIDDYNSSPASSAEKNDLRLISSLAYSF
jgi:putative salt-induced outer membrane protein